MLIKSCSVSVPCIFLIFSATAGTVPAYKFSRRSAPDSESPEFPGFPDARLELNVTGVNERKRTESRLNDDLQDEFPPAVPGMLLQNTSSPRFINDISKTVTLYTSILGIDGKSGRVQNNSSEIENKETTVFHLFPHNMIHITPNAGVLIVFGLITLIAFIIGSLYCWYELHSLP